MSAPLLSDALWNLIQPMLPTVPPHPFGYNYGFTVTVTVVELDKLPELPVSLSV